MSGLLPRWREGLAKTSRSAFGRLAAVLGATEIGESTWEGLEALLIQADLGIETTTEVIRALKQLAQEQGLTRSDELRAALRSELRGRLVPTPALELKTRPFVILLVGVNGSGKTTTIAKLARMFKDQGKSLVLGAADTFRAGATEQIQAWGMRLGVEVITGGAGSDPGAAAFNAVQTGLARGAEIILIDTAGRLQTRFNLMEELKKVYRVLGKAQEGAPHAVWLVLDATTGQNALHQARAFTQAVHVTGIILAKLDSSARGGMAFAIQHDLGLPVLFAGLGEEIADLEAFDPDAFVDGILA
jgi:fused signal recognition particle receptor